MNANYDRNRIQNTLAKNLLRIMGDNGMTIPELASACEVTPSSMKQLLAGQQFVSSRVLAGLCNALCVTPAMLFEVCDASPEEEPNAEESSPIEG